MRRSYRVTAILLILSLLLTVFPTAAMAAGGDDAAQPAEQLQETEPAEAQETPDSPDASPLPEDSDDPEFPEGVEPADGSGAPSDDGTPEEPEPELSADPEAPTEQEEPDAGEPEVPADPDADSDVEPDGEEAAGETPEDGEPEEPPAVEGASVDSWEEEYDVSGMLPADPDSLLLGYFESNLNGAFSAPRRSVPRGDSLTGNDRLAYDTIRPMIEAVAAGELASTEFQIPLSAFGIDAENGIPESELDLSGPVYVLQDHTYQVDPAVCQEAYDKIWAMSAVDLNAVYEALAADCPYDLYWSGKSVSTENYGISVSGAIVGSQAVATFLPGRSYIAFKFKVAPEYQGAAYETDTGLTASAATAAANANAIAEASGACGTDYEKLSYLKEAVCSRVTYNTAAAEQGSSGYGSLSPWQVIWVFDDDPDTNVVCEGYAKAFKYLCDLAPLGGGICCYTVTGSMDGGTGAGLHMWNVVRMEDGAYYMADVTNCDAGSVGYPGELFLCGCDGGSLADGYVFTANGRSVSYVYDAETTALYSEAELTVSDRDYDPAQAGSDFTVDENGVLTAYDGPGGDVVIPDGVTAIGNNAFKYNNSITSVTIPDTVGSIGDFAFAYCGNLTGITLPENLASIGFCAFQSSRSLTGITMPDTVTSVGAMAFQGCSMLSEVTISSGLSGIGANLFQGCRSLTNVVVPDGIVSIGLDAFSGCNGLVSITIPASVTSIGAGAFQPCDSLADVYYEGTSGQWDALLAGIGSDNDPLLSANVHWRTFAAITAQPVNLRVDVDASFQFTVEAVGDGIAYAWYYLLPGESAFVPGDAAGSEYSGTATESLSGMQVYCVVSDQYGNSVQSDTAQLTAAHDYGPWTVTTPPTCTKDGEETRTCTHNANHIETRSIPALGHSLTETAAHAASCDHAGNSAYWTCSTCGKYFADSEGTTEIEKNSWIIPATAHQWDAGTVTTPATYTEPGVRTYICTVCGATREEEIPVIQEQPVITVQPIAKSIVSGKYAKFTVTVTGGSLQYQWQFSRDGGATWKNSGATGHNTETLSVKGSASTNGLRYRCIISNAAGSITSDAAELTVLFAPSVTAEPTNKTIASGKYARFTVTATGGSLQYQWQFSKDGGTTWKNSGATGYNTKTLSVKGSASTNGLRYRCVISNAAGTATSTAVKLTVRFTPAVTTQPVANTVVSGKKASFTVTATGGGLKYRWQVSKDGGATWTNSVSTGSTTKTLTVTAYKSMNNYRYRCVITNIAGEATTNAVKLTVLYKPVITAQPTAKTVASGKTAAFTVTATGGSLKYQWQVSKDGGATWTNSVSTGSTTKTLTVTAYKSMNNYRYRCVITNSAGTTTSNAVKLTVT